MIPSPSFRADRFSGNLDGGAGTNWLDYSGYNVGVTVDLLASSATAISRYDRQYQQRPRFPL